MQSAGVQDGLPSLNFRFHLFLTISSFGKRTGRPLKISAVVPMEINTMTVWDRHSGRSFLVDCGADESVFSASDKRHRAPSVPLVPPTVHSSELGANASHPFYSARATHSPKNFTWQRSRNPFSALISLPPIGWPLTCLISVSLVSTISM